MFVIVLAVPFKYVVIAFKNNVGSVRLGLHGRKTLELLDRGVLLD